MDGVWVALGGSEGQVGSADESSNVMQSKEKREIEDTAPASLLSLS